MVGSYVAYGCANSVNAAPGVKFPTSVARVQAYSKLIMLVALCRAVFAPSTINFFAARFPNDAESVSFVNVVCLPFDSMFYQLDVLDHKSVFFQTINTLFSKLQTSSSFFGSSCHRQCNLMV